MIWKYQGYPSTTKIERSILNKQQLALSLWEWLVNTLMWHLKANVSHIAHKAHMEMFLRGKQFCKPLRTGKQASQLPNHTQTPTPQGKRKHQIVPFRQREINAGKKLTYSLTRCVCLSDGRCACWNKFMQIHAAMKL